MGGEKQQEGGERKGREEGEAARVEIRTGGEAKALAQSNRQVGRCCRLLVVLAHNSDGACFIILPLKLIILHSFTS